MLYVCILSEVLCERRKACRHCSSCYASLIDRNQQQAGMFTTSNCAFTCDPWPYVGPIDRSPSRQSSLVNRRCRTAIDHSSVIYPNVVVRHEVPCVYSLRFIHHDRLTRKIYCMLMGFSSGTAYYPSIDARDNSSSPLIGPKLLFSPSTNLPPTLFPLHPAPHPHLLIPYELRNHPDPARMLRQVCIELLGHLMQRRQTTPWNGRKIMVLVVQADVIRQDIQRPVVREGFRYRRYDRKIFCALRLFLENVMLGDEMSCTGV